MSKSTTPAKRTTPAAPSKRATMIYLPDTLGARLGAYMLAKHPGRLNVRSRIIVDAINEKLTREGF